MEVEYELQPFRPYVIRIRDKTEHKYLHALLDAAKTHQLSYTAETMSFIDELHNWINGPLEPKIRR